MCHGENKSPYTLWVGSGDRSGGDSNDAEFIFQFGPELPPGDHFTVTMKQHLQTVRSPERSVALRARVGSALPEPRKGARRVVPLEF